LDALVELRIEHPDVPIDATGLRRALDRALRDAHASLDARLIVEREARDRSKLVTATDAERTDDLMAEQRSATERVFRVLGLLYPKESYDLIQRGLSSDDPKIHALSVELCENVVTPCLRSAVVSLVDEVADEERLQGAAPFYFSAPSRAILLAGA